MKRSSVLFIFITIWLGFIQQISAVIVTTFSITSSTIKEIEDWIDKDAIIFIALDEVLVRPDYKMFGFGVNPYRNFETSLIMHARRNKVALGRLENWYDQRKLTLIEPEWKDFIERVQAKGAMVFGVCDMPVRLPDIEKKRYLEMLRLGIKFTESISGKNVLPLGQLGDWLSIFYQGIIFSGPISKEQSIVNLMKLSLYVPKKVVYFDVHNSAVKKLDRILRPFDMDFYSVIYNGIKEYRPEINYEEVEFQQRHFLQHQVLLSDDAVAEVMQRRLAPESFEMPFQQGGNGSSGGNRGNRGNRSSGGNSANGSNGGNGEKDTDEKGGLVIPQLQEFIDGGKTNQ